MIAFACFADAFATRSVKLAIRLACLASRVARSGASGLRGLSFAAGAISAAGAPSAAPAGAEVVVAFAAFPFGL